MESQMEIPIRQAKERALEGRQVCTRGRDRIFSLEEPYRSPGTEGLDCNSPLHCTFVLVFAARYGSLSRCTV